MSDLSIERELIIATIGIRLTYDRTPLSLKEDCLVLIWSEGNHNNIYLSYNVSSRLWHITAHGNLLEAATFDEFLTLLRQRFPQTADQS